MLKCVHSIDYVETDCKLFVYGLPLTLQERPDEIKHLGSRLCYQFQVKKIKIILEITIFFNKYIFLNYKKVTSYREIFSQFSLLIVLMSKILHLLSLFYPIFTCVDPDPYSKYGSGSTKLLNKDPIRIRIHNTEVWVFI